MELEFLKKLGFIEEEKNINKLKISRGKVEFDKEGRKSQIITPDLRYYWDGESLGIHMVNGRLSFEELFQFLLEENRTSLLEVLYLSDNDIINFSSMLFSRLYFLNINNCQNLLSAEIVTARINNKIQVNKIKELRIDYCKNLREIDFLGKFEELEKIEITNCSLTEFSTPKFSKKLTYLNLAYNKIEILNLDKSSKKLSYIYANNNRLKSFILIQKIDKINILDISHNNNCSFVVFQYPLENLESVNFAKTGINLVDLKRIRDFESLQEVNLSGTKIENDYSEDVKEGWKAVKRLLADKVVDFKHVKILLLGNTYVGKSDLVYYLKNNKQRTVEVGTHGIEYHQIKHPKYQKKEPYFLHIWDFGGDEYYHGTHKLFFSGGAINIILWSKNLTYRYDKEAQCFELEYWLRCAEQLSFNSPDNLISDTLLIENKIDKPKDSGFDYLPTYLNQEKYKDEFGSKMNLDFSYLSLKPGGDPKNSPKFFEMFKLLLDDKIESKKRKRPVEDIELLKKIQLRRTSVIPISDLSEFRDIETVLKVFHSMGILLYFHNEIPDLIFNKPQDFLDFLYKSILSRANNSKTFHYKISKNDISGSLYKSVFHRFLTIEQILKVLKSFDLIFSLKGETDTFFIPQYLPKTNPQIIIYKKQIENHPSVYIESDSYLMNLVIMKLFSKYGSYVINFKENHLFALDQLIVELNGLTVFIEFDRPNQRLNLYESTRNEGIELIDELVKFVLSLNNNESLNSGNWLSNIFQVYITGNGIDYVSFSEAYKQYESQNWKCLSIESKLVELGRLNRFFNIKNENIVITKNDKYKELVNKIKNKDAVLFLGTGISAYTTNNAPCSTWSGLLRNGIQYCLDNNISGCNQQWFDTMTMLLNLNEVNQWIHVAETITQKLIAAKSYKTWIKKTIGGMPIVDKDLIENLGKLDLPVFTTNYDDLVEKILNKDTVSDNDIDKIQEVLKSTRSSVVHIHGHWDFASTLIFGSRSYFDIAENNEFQSQMKSLMMNKNIIFVGFGNGLADPNFGPLMEWSKTLGSEHHHFKLVKNNELGTANLDPKVQNVGYGDNYDDLVPFLEEVLKDIKV